MAAPSAVRSGVGFRNVRVFALDADGYPAATDTSAYEGIAITGSKALTIEDPEPQQIIHRGDDRIFALDVLPPTDPISGELRVGKISDTVDAALSDDAAFTVGEANFFGIGTDSRGDEDQVALLAYRQAVDTDPNSANFGARRWEFRLFPKCFVIRREGGFEDTPEDRAYTVRPQFVRSHLWGVDFDAATEGFEQAQGLRGVSEFKPKIVAFLGDTSATTFTFPSGATAQATGKIVSWIDGVLTTADTLGTDSIGFAVAPDTDAVIVVFYEHE